MQKFAAVNACIKKEQPVLFFPIAIFAILVSVVPAYINFCRTAAILLNTFFPLGIFIRSTG